MNKKEELKQIQAEIKVRTKEFVDSNKPQLEELRNAISKQYQELYRESLNYVRNISIVSGTIAPFSLLLLQVDTLNLSVSFLVLGFIVLLLNILYTQYIIFYDLTHKEKNVTHATLYQLVADGDLSKMERSESPESTHAMFDYIEHFRTALSHLQANENYYMEVDSIKRNSMMRKQLRYSVYALGFGIVAIVMSVLFVHIHTFVLWMYNSVMTGF